MEQQRQFVIFNEVQMLHDEEFLFQEIVAEQNYSGVVKNNIQVVKNFQVVIQVNNYIRGISDSSIQDFVRQFAYEQGKHLEFQKSMQKKIIQGGVRFIWGFLSLCRGNSYQDGYRKKSQKISCNAHDFQKRFYSKLIQKAESDLTVQGAIMATGTLLIPQKVNVYIETMQIISAKGQSKLLVCGNSAKVLDQRGNDYGDSSDLMIVDQKDQILSQSRKIRKLNDY